ncbi:MAG: class I SAM-dependent methyltransferase [Agarilytica sp.]
MLNIAVCAEIPELEQDAQAYAEQRGLAYAGVLFDQDAALVFGCEKIFLAVKEKKKYLSIDAEFAQGSVAHRRQFGGGKGQQIAKAVGLSKGFTPNVLDATAGLGKDAFVLATLGAKITLVERSPVVHALLENGLTRARNFAEHNEDADLADILGRIQLIESDSGAYLTDTDEMFDIVYLDPMFPERKKSALVKKEMRVFHDIVGTDDDADRLLVLAMDRATYRVVVKRPRVAPDLANTSPAYRLEGKSSRFDIYTKCALPV